MTGISKLDAADRLIVAGVAMLERGDDPLATHVVASSALNLLRELVDREGERYQLRVLREGLFLMASARAAGISDPVAVHPAADKILDALAAAIAAGEVVRSSQIDLNLPRREVDRLLDHVYRAFNFLKHADRDALGTLQPEEVRPEDALQHALLAMSWLQPARGLPESCLPFARRLGIVLDG